MKTFAISFLCSPSKIRKSGESPVEVSISVNGERTCVQLQKYCTPDTFRKKLESRNANDIKTFCEDVKAKINAYQTMLTIQGKQVTAKKIKAYLKGEGEKSCTLLELCNDYLKTKVSKPSAYSKYRNTFDRFKDFIGQDREIADITTQDIINYKEKWEKKFAPGTMRNEMKKVKSLFLFAFNSGRLTRSPYSSLQFTFRDEPMPYLSYEEIVALRGLKLDDRLDRVRNFFLFLCFSGLEYSDFVHLDKSKVQRNSYGQLYYKAKRVKTGVDYISIFYEDAEELWDLFEGDIPYVSNQKANAYLKEIATAAGIQKNVTTLTARHTYATYLLSKLLIPVDVVQRMLGHTSPRQSLRYAKMVDDAVFQANLGKRNPYRAPEPTKEDMQDLKDFSDLFGI